MESKTGNSHVYGGTTIYVEVVEVGEGYLKFAHLNLPFQVRITPEQSAILQGRKLDLVGLSGMGKYEVYGLKMVDFTIKDVWVVKKQSAADAFKELRESLGKYWDEIDDPASYIAGDFIDRPYAGSC